MKKIYSLTALAFFAASSLMAQGANPTAVNHESVQTVPGSRLGQDVVRSLRQSYESGAYDAFLANLNADYLKFVQSGKFAEFVKMRGAPEADAKLKDLATKWEVSHHKLVQERNEALIAACAGNDDQILSQRVRSAIATLPEDQKEALHYLSNLRFKTPENAINGDEKKLIEIDLASEFKMVHLDAQYAQKPFEDRFEKHIVISLDMLKQMQDASASFKDTALQKKIALAAAGYDSWLSRNWDLNLLNQVVRKPMSEFEKKIAAILTEFKAKKDDLYQKEFVSQLDKQ